MSNPEVAMIRMSDGMAITEDGQLLPVTLWQDDDGQDCDQEDATHCVAGPDTDGKWVHIDFAVWNKVPVQ